MSEGTTPGTESEENPGAAGAAGTGSSGEGSAAGSGSQSTAGTPAEDQVAAVEARRRALQSENDRLKNELAAAQAAGKPGTQEAPAITEDRILALMRSERELARAETQLRSEYSLADPELFDRSYDSVEAMTAAVKTSHERVTALVKTGSTEAESELLKRYREAYGELDVTPPDTDGGTPTGDPTPAQIEAMSLGEMDAYEAAHPGVIDRVMRSA